MLSTLPSGTSLTDKTIPLMAAPSSFFCDFVVPSVFKCKAPDLACSRMDVTVALCAKLTVVSSHVFSYRMHTTHLVTADVLSLTRVRNTSEWT